MEEPIDPEPRLTTEGQHSQAAIGTLERFLETWVARGRPAGFIWPALVAAAITGIKMRGGTLPPGVKD